MTSAHDDARPAGAPARSGDQPVHLDHGTGADVSANTSADSSAAAETGDGAAPHAEGAPPRVRWARAFLARVAEPGSPAIAAFVAGEGPLRAAQRIQAGDPDLPALVLRSIRSPRDVDAAAERAARDLDDGEARGTRFVVPEDPQWPAATMSAFDTVADPPVAPVPARGSDSPNTVPSVAHAGGTVVPASPGAQALAAPLGLWVRGRIDLAAVFSIPRAPYR